MRFVRTLIAGIVVLGALVGLAACGGSSHSSTSASSSSGAQTSADVKGKAPFKLGFICSCSGPSAAATAHTGDVIKAWASSVNASGGINGSPVEVTVIDDGTDAAKSLQAAKQLVSDGVMAIVGHASLQDGAWADYVAKQGIPVVGGLSPQPSFFTNPDFFPVGAVLPAVILGQMREAADAGKKNYGVAFCSEIPVCKQLIGLSQAAAAAAGGAVQVTGRSISFTQPTYTAQCLGFKDAGVDSLFAAAPSPVVVKVSSDCAQQGYKPTPINQAGTADTTWLKDPAMDGAIIVSPNVPVYATSIPAVKEYADAMAKYAPDVLDSPQHGQSDLTPWASGKLFEAAAAAGKLTPSSKPADVATALYSLKDETLGGLSGPLNYVKGKPSFPACYFVEGVSDGKFTTPKGADAICPTADEITKLQTALAG